MPKPARGGRRGAGSSGRAPIRRMTLTTRSGRQQTFNVIDSLPSGWRQIQGALTAPTGYRWVSNGVSRFSNDYQQALISDSAFRR